MNPAEKDTVGTDIILHIKPSTDTDNYENFLDEYGIAAIVKKYSDYVRYPIQMEREKSRQKPEPDPKPDDYKPEWETYTELETLNSMVPIWKKQKSEVFRPKSMPPSTKISSTTTPTPPASSSAAPRAPRTTTPCSFVPSHSPLRLLHQGLRKGLALYASGVLIMEKCGDCCPITSASSRASWTART